MNACGKKYERFEKNYEQLGLKNQAKLSFYPVAV